MINATMAVNRLHQKPFGNRIVFTVKHSSRVCDRRLGRFLARMARVRRLRHT
jgi:hypothetical protein